MAEKEGKVQGLLLTKESLEEAMAASQIQLPMVQVETAVMLVEAIQHVMVFQAPLVPYTFFIKRRCLNDRKHF